MTFVALWATKGMVPVTEECRGGEAEGQEVGEEDRQGADQGEDDAGEAFVDAAGHLVEAGDEEGEARGVGGARLGRVGADREAVPFVEVLRDRRVGGGVE